MPTPREAFENSVQRDRDSGARLQPADFGSAGEMVGRAAQGFGQEVMRSAEAVDEIRTRDAETAAREADNIRTANRLKRMYEGADGYFNKEGRDALTDQEKLTADLRRIDEEAAQTLANKPLARRFYDRQTQRRNADDLPKIFQHASRERNKYEDQVDADAMDLAIDSAATSLDPTHIAENITTVGDIAERVARRKGMSDGNTLRQVRQSATGKAVTAIAKRMEQQSPAEAMAFVTLHAQEMDPQDAVTLMDQLAPSASKERAGSDIGNFLVVAGEDAPVSGEAPPTAGPTLMPPEAALEAAQWQQESGGQHIDPKTGRLIRSSAGALGVSQTMPDTGVDPGYGVKPLQNNSRAEYIRFGNDYRKAMLKEYRGNVVLALTAYNWGPGNVNAHIAKVGDPSKGEISDAAFLNSIENKEAREYASTILNRVGVSVSGSAGPSAGRPVAVGEEIDLEATINNIRNSDRSFVDKEALIAEASRMHSYGRTVKAENEEQATDAAWTAINNMGDKPFTDYDQLPLDVRTELAKNPKLAVTFKKQAATNKAAIDKGKVTEAEHNSQLNLLDLYYGAPEKFNEIDFRTQYPELSFTSKKAMMLRQEAYRKRQENPTNEKTADFSRVRTEINRFVSKNNPQPNIGVAYDEAIRKEQAWLDANPGKLIPDAVRVGIAREVMMPVTIVAKGKLWGTNERTVPAYAAPIERERVGGAYAGRRVEPRQAIRAQLEQVWGRIPTEAEIDAEVAKRTTDRGLRL